MSARNLIDDPAHLRHVRLEVLTVAVVEPFRPAAVCPVIEFAGKLATLRVHMVNLSARIGQKEGCKTHWVPASANQRKATVPTNCARSQPAGSRTCAGGSHHGSPRP